MKKWGLTTKILVALGLGILTGLILYQVRDQAIVKDYIIGFLFAFVGKVFINAIRMMVVPLVFISITVGAASMADIRKLGRIGTKTVLFYLITTAIAVTNALVLTIMVQPGVGFEQNSAVKFAAKEAPKLVDVLANMVPENPVAALAKGNMLQIIIFSVLLGIAITTLGEKAKRVKEGFEALNEVVLKLVMMIMAIAPYGVFALVAKTSATLGYQAMKPLLAYMLCVLVALLIHAIFTYQGLLYIFTRLNPIKFYKNFAPAMMLAFSTASSSATLPVTMETSERRLGSLNLSVPLRYL